MITYAGRDAIAKVMLALESEGFPIAAEAETEVELEHCWYGQLVDRTELEAAATVESQEQWQVKSHVEDCQYGGSIRVRKTVRGDMTSYMLCIKAFEQGKLGVLENEFEINEGTFEQFKRIAESGMIKTRYTFPIEGTQYAFEVDLPPDQEDDAWVKIDLEIDDPKYPIPEMPIQLKGLVKDVKSTRSPEQEKLIKAVQSRYFAVPNAYAL